MASTYHPGYAQQLVSQGFGGYAGWGDDEAFADFQATQGQGKQTQQANVNQDPGQRAETNIEETYRRQNEERNKLFGEYRERNPFSADEYLAKTATSQAKEQVDPYYNETLSNYLLGIDRKISRTAKDTQDLLGELTASTQSYSDRTQRQLDRALENSRQGFADTGLFESGARYRTEGTLQTEAGEEKSNFLRQQSLREKGYTTNLSRLQEDYGLGSLTGQNLRDIGNIDLSNPGLGLYPTQEIRDLQRARLTDIGTTAGQLTKEAGQRYVTGFNAIVPPALQNNTNGDLLKQIGIYG